MQHISRTAAARAAYHAYIQGDHDFRVWADVLTLNENYVGTLELLDGQVDLTRGTEGPCRTAALTLSDPEGTMNFGNDYMRDPKGVLWIDRLIQVWHAVDVPGYGTWETSVIVGLPTSVARSGAEISLELGDKSLLADHGVRAKTFKKGMRIDVALQSVLQSTTGEAHFRIPKVKKTLSRLYTVGMGEDALTPWQLFKRIAGQEMGWRAYYDGLGFAVCEPTSAAKHPLVIKSLLALPESSTSFTDFVNYSKVTSHRKPSNNASTSTKNEKKGSDITIVHESVVALTKGHELSEQSLARHGVPRTMPVVVVNDDLKTLSDTMDAAVKQLKAHGAVQAERSFEIIPVFHMEPFDTVRLPFGVGDIRLLDASIPLCVGGNMTIGAHKWVAKPTKVRRVRRKTTVQRVKRKGGKAHGN